MALRDKKTVPLLQVGRWPHGSLGYWMAHYLLWLQQHNLSTGVALRTTSHPLERLHEWCHLRGLEQPEAITLAALESYQQRLYYWRKSNGEPLAVSTQCTHLAQIKRFFAWLAKRHILKANPASELELPKVGQRLPQDVLSPEEVEKVLRQPDIHTVQGLRDRAILEVLYGSGLRRTELCQLTVNSINMEKGTVMVRQGKGKKATKVS
ncbi:tyrosine-type recombinase/integrase [Serratia sp. UGAL515B_01]|uniref:tyrosine-type recombinase/integrase n=1 Tax=Serratia sp. UGAL515B_01 TaxID=2986763 RepID=UPI00295348A1|nr:tyrosine-type recombinase/integrase [Serratia sp. UGAL515B_01]WON75612.1 tyrosine-type recombinase/integrase [Serratia sp. UGAL515B_01]